MLTRRCAIDRNGAGGRGGWLIARFEFLKPLASTAIGVRTWKQFNLEFACEQRVARSDELALLKSRVSLS